MAKTIAGKKRRKIDLPMPNLKAVDLRKTIIFDEGSSHEGVLTGPQYQYLVLNENGTFDVGYFDYDDYGLSFQPNNYNFDCIYLTDMKGLWRFLK